MTIFVAMYLQILSSHFYRKVIILKNDVTKE